MVEQQRHRVDEQVEEQSPPPTRYSPPLDLHHDDLNPNPNNNNPHSPQSIDSPQSTSSDQSSLSHVSSPAEHVVPPPAVFPAPPAAIKVEDGVPDGFPGERKTGSGGGRAGGGRPKVNSSVVRRGKSEATVKRALLVFRACGFVLCLVSFSVLAADKNQGWAIDSFYRYKEFRFSLSVNVIGFVYSGIQMIDLAYQLSTGKTKSQLHLRHYLDFATDQMLTYLLMSASSSAAVRVDDWQSNWGADKFPEMARASVALSFLAFVALAFSSVMSGYTLCTLKST